MLTQLTMEDVRFLARLAVHPEFAPLQSILQRELSSHDAKCRCTDGPALYRHQGASQLLVDFASEIAGAKDKLESMMEERRRQALRSAKQAA